MLQFVLLSNPAFVCSVTSTHGASKPVIKPGMENQLWCCVSPDNSCNERPFARGGTVLGSVAPSHNIVSLLLCMFQWLVWVHLPSMKTVLTTLCASRWQCCSHILAIYEPVYMCVLPCLAQEKSSCALLCNIGAVICDCFGLVQKCSEFYLL